MLLTVFCCLLAVAMQSRGGDTDYAECKAGVVVQSAQQQSLMSSVYLPTNSYQYYSDDDDERRVGILTMEPP